MDIASFVNSNAIKQHLIDIGYEFNSLEAAWLIYRCIRLTYNEKKKAWLELIDTMPDCSIPERHNCRGWDSLHDFLKRVIAITDREIEDFFREEAPGEYVYMYSYFYKGDQTWSEEYETVFPTMTQCLEAYRTDRGDLDETYSPDGTGVQELRLRKQSLSDPQRRVDLECRADEQVVSVIENSDRTAEESEIAVYLFEGLWFDFPTPFKKGDIVWIPKDDNLIRWNMDGGFVLLDLITWMNCERVRDYGDNWDMCSYGYFVNENGTVYREVSVNYMDLEYYPGPYKLNEKILPALSKFVKGEIDLEYLLCAYRKTLLDVAADDIMMKSWLPEEMLEDIGLK